MTNRCAHGIDIDMPVMVNYDIPVDAQNRADCETYLRRCVPAFVTGMQFTWYNLSPLSLLTPHPPYPSPSSPLFLLTLSLLTLSLLTPSPSSPSPSSPPLPPHPLPPHPLSLLYQDQLYRTDHQLCGQCSFQALAGDRTAFQEGHPKTRCGRPRLTGASNSMLDKPRFLWGLLSLTAKLFSV